MGVPIPTFSVLAEMLERHFGKLGTWLVRAMVLVVAAVVLVWGGLYIWTAALRPILRALNPAMPTATPPAHPPPAVSAPLSRDQYNVTNNGSGNAYGRVGTVIVHPVVASPLKNQLRELLGRVDANLLSEIDAGKLQVRCRIAGTQFDNLTALTKKQPKGQPLVLGATVVGHLEDSQISNGSCGPTTAEQLQYVVDFNFSPRLQNR